MLEINYDLLVRAIELQFNTIISANKEKYNDIKVYSGNERFFETFKLGEKEIGTIIKFGDANINLKQVVLPVNIEVIGLSDIKLTQKLLTEFSFTYNEETTNNVEQYWNLPTLNESISQYGIEYRNHWSIAGSFIVTSNGEKLQIEYFNDETNEYEKIKVLNHIFEANNTPLPEPTGASNGRNITTNQAQTVTLNFVTYFINTKLIKDVLTYNLVDGESFNHDYKFKLTFGNMGIVFEKTYKSVNIRNKGMLGQNDSIELSFSM